MRSAKWAYFQAEPKISPARCQRPPSVPPNRPAIRRSATSAPDQAPPLALCSRPVRRPHWMPVLLWVALGCAARQPQPPHSLSYPNPLQASPKATSADSTPTPRSPLTGSERRTADDHSGSVDARVTPSVVGPAAQLATFGSEPIAGTGPLVLEQASSSGTWLVVCQARNDSNGDGQLRVSVGPRGDTRGDSLERYLITPGGQELVIDDWLASDASQRFLLIVKHGALLLWDSQTRKMQDLSALNSDTRLSAESFAAVRTLSFDAESKHLLYVRSGQQGKRLVLRALDDGSERELDPGPGPIWRAHIDPGGTYAVLQMLTDDTNKNGKADFPAPLLVAPRPCGAGPGRFHSWVGRGDHPETVLVPLAGGVPIHEPGLIMPVRDALLVRDANGALFLQRAGKQRLLEPAACKGRIVHADPTRESFIIGCTQKKRPERGSARRELSRVSLELVTQPVAVRVGAGAGQPASLQVRTIASLVSKYTCQ